MNCFGAYARLPCGRHVTPLLRKGHELLRHVLLNTCLMGICVVFVVVFVYSVVIQQSSTSVDPHPQNQYDGCVSSESSIQNNESVNSVVIEGTRELNKLLLC